MRLPEDVDSVLKVRGEKAAIALLCRQHGMSHGAAMAWVAACSDWRLPDVSRPLSKVKIATLMTAAFAAGMLLAGLEKLL
ncbi:hypothetical protein [Alcanivorax jadensis]|uniref:hypothetical protein n=1 Tax=Alcanivorax jadensis TaxID=64988 RepID=UPI0026ED1A9A|nr:hypothetical protein [Alcanivorax jadensis]MCK5886405.1 hypothetical protein [Alcanivorax sp.]